MRHAKGRTTLCVSSQVGCKMGCTFCATGTLGELWKFAQRKSWSNWRTRVAMIRCETSSSWEWESR